VVHGRIHCNAANDSILEQLADLLDFLKEATDKAYHRPTSRLNSP
jgi:hypothetical protein